MTALAGDPPFPSDLPPSVARVLDEPRFDPARHLALEKPGEVLTLEDFGYDAETRAGSPSPVAVAGPFRVLSDEGVAVLQEILRALAPDADIAAGRRLSVFLRRSVQRSAFVRGLASDPSLLQHLSEIAETPLCPHSIPGMQSFVNFAPQELSRSVDSWHVDSIGFDAVMMVSDPAKLTGGRLEYFRGTRRELAQLLGAEDERQLVLGFDAPLPAERIHQVSFPAAGHALFMQGDLVFHRAAPLAAPAERITLVAGLLARALDFPDRTNTAHMQNWRETDILTDAARHAAWLAREKLSALLEEIAYAPGDRRLALAEALERAVADATRVAAEMREAAAREFDNDDRSLRSV